MVRSGRAPSAFTHWIDCNSYHTMRGVHVNPECRVRSDGQMIMSYPALYLLKRHRLRRRRRRCARLARFVLQIIPTREVILRQRVELVAFEFWVEQRAIELEILGANGSG